MLRTIGALIEERYYRPLPLGVFKGVFFYFSIGLANINYIKSFSFL